MFCTVGKSKVDLPRINKIVLSSEKLGRKLGKFNFYEKLKRIFYFWVSGRYVACLIWYYYKE